MPIRPRISWTALLLPLLVALIVVAVICISLYLREANQEEKAILERETQRMRIYGDLLAGDFNSTISDLQQLATGDKLQDYLLSGQQADLDRAIKRAVFFSRENPDYDQVRYLDEKGNEVLRVNANGVIVPPTQLQNKADRPYFQKAMTLDHEQAYVSAFDLNVEKGKIELPYKPMLRFAYPVFDANGKRRGVYIINFLAQNSITRLENFVRPEYKDRLRLLNARGYWLRGAKPEDNWGFMIPARSNSTLSQTNPDLWAHILLEPDGQVPLDGGYFTWHRVEPRQMIKTHGLSSMADDDFYIMASQISSAEWNAYFAALRQTFVVVALILMFLAVIINWIFNARLRIQRERDRFFNLTRDMLCIAGFDGYFKRVNSAWTQTIGYSSAEMLGQPFLEFVHPDDRAKNVAETNRLATGGETTSFENRYRCKDGTYRWLLWSARPLVREQLIFASARDLTERKQIEEKLRQSEERSRLMVESVKDYSIFMLDPNGKVVSWNPGAERIMGYTAEEIIGQHFSRFFLEEEVVGGIPEKELLEAGQKGRAETENWRVRKDGSRFWADAMLNAVTGSGGDLKGFVKVTRDVSERRRAEESLRISEERSRTIIESAYDAFISIDINGRITDWNLQAESIFGWSREEAIGRFLHETIIPEKYRANHLRGIEHLKATGDGPVLNKTIELVGLRRNGDEFPVELVIWPMQMGNELTFHSFIRDITDRKKTAENIEKLNVELKQRADLQEVANKELEAFSYSVSHDLRAPLRHIHGFVELLQKAPSIQADESSKRQMGIIARAAQEMGMLIDDLLAFSRTGRAEMHPVKIDMREMIDQIIRDREMECQDRKVRWEIGPLERVWGDPSLLRLVWTNLLDNALKYTRRRPEAKIEIGQITEDRPGASAQEMVFFVRDNGVGFDMQYAAKLFGVFQRLHRAADFEGTGIGLANVQRIIHRHGGRVWAEAALDKGATFYFSLPVNAIPPT
jgi:PAS domain S-box-containing protein